MAWMCEVAARRASAVVALVMVIGGGVLAGCDGAAAPSVGSGGAAAAPARPVMLVRVEARPVRRFVEVTGTLFGQEDVTISAEVPGRVIALGGDLGDRIEPGALLAQIDPTEYQLAVDEAEAALGAALARLGLEALPQGAIDLGTLPTVARAEAQEHNARARLERSRRLFERTPPLMSEQDFADFQTEHEVALTSVNVERLSARGLIAEARVREAALRRAEKRLEDTFVRAPSQPGLVYRVAARRVSVGERVTEGQPVFRLVASDRVRFRGQAPERYLRAIRAEAPAELVVSGAPAPFAATVTRVAPAVAVETRSFEIEIEAENRDGELRPGSFVLARIEVADDVPGLFVPASAIVQFAGVQRVFSVRDGKAVEHRVRAGPESGGMREILEGLTGVDVVIDSPRGIVQGVRVSVASHGDAAAPSGDDSNR